MAYGGDPRERSTSIPLALILLSLFGLILPDVVRLGVQQAEAHELRDSLTEGILALGSESYTQAIEQLLEARKEQPHSPDPLYYLGLAYNATGQYDLAIPTFLKAKEFDPDNLDIHLQLGLAYLGKEDYVNAHPALAYVFEQAPGTPNLGFYLGHIYFLEGDHSKAIATLKANVSADPHYQQLARYDLALAEHATGNVEDATVALQETIQASPGSRLATQAEQFMDQMRLAAKPKRLRLYAQITGQYDDNVRLAPVENVFNLRDQKFNSMVVAVQLAS